MALTDEQLEIISDALLPLFQYLEKEVIADVAKRIKNSLAYTRSAELKAESMQKLGYSPAKIRSEAMKILNADAEYRKMVAKNTLEHKKEVKKILRDIMKSAQAEKDAVLSDSADLSYFDDLKIWKEGGMELTDNSYLPQLVEAIQRQTAGELKNLARSTGFKTMSGFEPMEDLYRKELDKAMIKVCTGTFSRDQVVYDVVHSLADSGLRTIDYASGYSMQLDTAVKLAMRTGAHQLAGKVTDKNIENTGVNLVRVSKHWGARNTGTGHANHEQWQGKVYFVKEGQDYSEEAKRISQDRITSLWHATGYSVDGAHKNDPLGLYGYHCRHRHYPWFIGVSVFPKEDPEPKPVTINGKTYDYYAITQKQRAMERSIRALKREREAMKALQMDTKEVSAKIKRKIREYEEFSDAAGVSAKNNRLRYECGTSDLRKTDAWHTYKAVTPQRNIVDFVRYRSKEIDFRETAETINKELDSICTRPTKWSGRVTVERNFIGSGRKEWDCSITLKPSAGYADELHELIHARSISYFDEEIYKQFYNIEEGSVELLTEEICKRKKIVYDETYKEQVKHLRRINRRAKLYVSDYDFAKDLINVELPDRIEWLIEKIGKNYSQGLIPDNEMDGIWDSFALLVEEYRE